MRKGIREIINNLTDREIEVLENILYAEVVDRGDYILESIKEYEEAEEIQEYANMINKLKSI